MTRRNTSVSVPLDPLHNSENLDLAMRERLDMTLVERGLVASRARARDVIRRGLVLINGAVTDKPATLVDAGAQLSVLDGAGTEYVSRSALKLKAALDHFGFDPAGATALDIGASTGGFTQLLLERTAARVYAVDVGRGQLDHRLRDDPRVVSLEACDARTLDSRVVPHAVDAIVADVSFISLEKVLPAALALAGPRAWLIALAKPQFQVGPERVGKGGIVRDEGAREEAVSRVAAWLGSQPHWSVIGILPSPIDGGSGNREALIGARRDA